jgi:hypothetical protein
MSITTEIFVPDLKTNPHLNFARFQGVVFQEAMNTENPIRGLYGLLYIFLSDTEWEALPGNLLVLVERPLSRPLQQSIVPDTTTKLQFCALLTTHPTPFSKKQNCKRTIRLQYIKHTCSCVQSFFRSGRYHRSSILSQDDFIAIIAQLKAAMSATQIFAALASTHHDLHSILVQAGLPISELEKCSYLMDALNKDAAGMYAAQLYSQSFPLIHTGLSRISTFMHAMPFSQLDLCNMHLLQL